MVVKSETMWDKVLSTVVSGAIMATAGAGIATYTEVKALRLELSGMSEKQQNMAEVLKEHGKRIQDLELKCGR